MARAKAESDPTAVLIQGDNHRHQHSNHSQAVLDNLVEEIHQGQHERGGRSLLVTEDTVDAAGKQLADAAVNVVNVAKETEQQLTNNAQAVLKEVLSPDLRGGAPVCICCCEDHTQQVATRGGHFT